MNTDHHQTKRQTSSNFLNEGITKTNAQFCESGLWRYNQCYIHLSRIWTLQNIFEIKVGRTSDKDEMRKNVQTMTLVGV